MFARGSELFVSTVINAPSTPDICFKKQRTRLKAKCRRFMFRCLRDPKSKQHVDRDATLTGNTALYSSRKNRAPGEINGLGCAKVDLVERLRGYTQLM
jgi:hypothetical protein